MDIQTVIGIPTGNRKEQALECVKAWNEIGISTAVITWDYETYALLEGVATYLFLSMEMMSFAKNHNQLADKVSGWDVYICGADDLFPAFNSDQIPMVANRNDGRCIWVDDRLNDQVPTHPVITKGWYQKYHQIFDERFRHNFVDNDFYIRTVQRKELIRYPRIFVDHRHYLKTGAKPDRVYQTGLESFEDDKLRFYAKYGGRPELALYGKREELAL